MKATCVTRKTRWFASTRPSNLSCVVVLVSSWPAGPTALGAQDAAPRLVESTRVESTRIVPLDGGDWLLLPDPANAGTDEGWFRAPRDGAKRTRVPPWRCSFSRPTTKRPSMILGH